MVIRGVKADLILINSGDPDEIERRRDELDLHVLAIARVEPSAEGTLNVLDASKGIASDLHLGTQLQ